MASDADGTASTTTFELTCIDCSFERTVDGTVDDALDVADDHREERGNGAPTDHFVNFERSNPPE